MTFLEFTEGPMWRFAAFVFLLGVFWHQAHWVMRRHPKDLSKPVGSGFAGAVGTLFRHFLPSPHFLSRNWLVTFAGYAFHLGLFALILFFGPHIEFIQTHITGFGWEPMPYWGFIVACQLAFAGLLILWLKRVLDPVLRLISDSGDQVGTLLTFIVMLTGCMALMQSYDFLRALHMLTVNLWLIYFPFSRLMHAFTWVLSRAETGAVYGRRGSSL